MEKLRKSNFKFQMKIKWQKGKVFIMLEGNNSKNKLEVPRYWRKNNAYI